MLRSNSGKYLFGWEIWKTCVSITQTIIIDHCVWSGTWVCCAAECGSKVAFRPQWAQAKTDCSMLNMNILKTSLVIWSIEEEVYFLWINSLIFRLMLKIYKSSELKCSFFVHFLAYLFIFQVLISALIPQDLILKNHLSKWFSFHKLLAILSIHSFSWGILCIILCTGPAFSLLQGNKLTFRWYN